MRRWRSLFRSTIGKKVLMALSGAVIFGYSIGHMAGNLQVFAGAEVLNGYAHTLHTSPVLLWGTRLLLLLAFPVHIVTATQLTALSVASRPVSYRQRRWTYASFASRTMRYTGFVFALFLLFHLAHLTWGLRVTPAAFVEGDAFGNLARSMSIPWVALIYVIAAVLVGLHLSHGSYSMFQSLGLDHPKYTPIIRQVGMAITAIVAVGFLIVPVALFFKIIGGEG